MKKELVRSRHFIATSLLVVLGGALLLSACDGQAFINFTYDPTTGVGSGNIQITGPAPEATDSGGGGGGNQGMNQVVLFAVVVALLIGVLAVVAASGRRRRVE